MSEQSGSAFTCATEALFAAENEVHKRSISQLVAFMQPECIL